MFYSIQQKCMKDMFHHSFLLHINVISPIRGEAPRKRIFTKFCTSGDMLDVIICASFGVEKLRGLGNTSGQILEFPIEMAGHPYNRAGATAQPVI